MQGDSTKLGTTRRGMGEGGPMLVRLSGDFDVRYERILEDTLSDCLASGGLTLVDLSGVTFMDSRCVRELAFHYQLGEGRLALCDPSPEVELSVAACDLESWIDFIYTAAGDPAAVAAASAFQEVAIDTRERN